MCHLIDKINLSVSHAAVIEQSWRLSYPLVSVNSLRLFQASTSPRCWEGIAIAIVPWEGIAIANRLLVCRRDTFD